MAKLTVFFKDRAIQSDLFENGIVRIGRDETNDLMIDSLAVAPEHAIIHISDDNSIIKQVNLDFPLMLNGVKIKEAPIKDNDTISLGKHEIVFNATEVLNSMPQIEETTEENSNPFNWKATEIHIPAANLQILNGENIGKIIAIKKTILQIGRKGSGIVAVTKRKDGYYVSVLENIGTITLNDVPINDNSIKLNNNDILAVNDRSMQFFQG